MTYMFFESTHANYDFPPESAIAEPYLKDLNYITADFNAQIGEIKNRYINAAHHVDSQIGRVINHLQQHCGWKPERMLTPTGMAEADPRADNSTPEGRAQNRRVAVNILVSKSVDGM